MRAFVFVLLTLLLMLPATSAWAACSNPAAIEGEFIYNQDYQTVQYCDGTAWIRMGGAFAESDPEVGDVNTPNNLCRADGTQVICDLTAGDREILFRSAGIWTSSAGLRFTSTGRLTVPSSIQVGDDTGVCDFALNGAVRYRSGLGMYYCDGIAWRNIALSGTGVALSFNPPSKFDMDVDGTCGQAWCQGSIQSFVLTNNGDLTSDVLSWTSSGDFANFTITADTCSGNALAPGGQCTIDVEPQTDGNNQYSLTLSVPHHNAPIATLQGNGSQFGCFAGMNGFGGVVASCDFFGPGIHLIAMPGGCDGSTSEPTCSGGADSVLKAWALSSSEMGSTVQDIYEGPQNTVNLMAYAQPGGTFPAAEYCDAMTYNGFSDWYLPAQEELKEACLNQAGNLSFDGSTGYHASTEFASTPTVSASIWMTAPTCSNYNMGKLGVEEVRCFRREGEALPAAQTDDTPVDLIYATKFASAGGLVKQSDTLTVTGITPGIAVSIAGDPSAQFSINGGAFTSAPGTVSWGDTVQMQMTSAAPGVRIQADVTIGTKTFNWSVITESDCGGGGCAGVDKRVFVTSTTYSAGLGGLGGADAKCQTQADAVPLGGTWKAIISGINYADSAAHRMDYNWDRLVDVNSTVIADDAQDLWDGSIDNQITDEFGSPQTGVTWTNTTSDGMRKVSTNDEFSCFNWATGNNYGDDPPTRYGDPTVIDSTWIDRGTGSSRCSSVARLYCLEVTQPTINIVLTPTSQTGMDVTGPGNPAYGLPVTFTAENQGSGTSAVLTASLSSSVNFEIINDNCTGNTLAPTATCTFDVRPKAFADGNYNSTVTIDDGAYSDNAGLSGTALGFGNAAGLWLRGADDDIYYDSGANPMVGIGVSDPGTELDVAGIMRAINDAAACTANERGAVRFNSAAGQMEICESGSWSALGGTVTALDDIGDVTVPAPVDGNILSYDSTTGEWVAGVAIKTVPGNLPTGMKLDELGDVNAPGPNDSEILMYSATGGSWIAAPVPTGQGGKWLDGVEPGEIYYSSNVGILTDNPSVEFEVAGISKTNVLRLTTVTGAASPQAANSAGGGTGEVQFNSGGALFGNGAFVWNNATTTLGIGTGTPDDGKVEVKGGTVCVDTDNDGNATSCITAESDLRLKKNVRQIPNGLDIVMALRGVSFDWRWDEYGQIGRYRAKPHDVGVIAQDVQKVLPEALGEDINGYMSVEYRLLIPPMIEAIKEQQGYINAQDSLIDRQSRLLRHQTTQIQEQATAIKALQDRLTELERSYQQIREQ